MLIAQITDCHVGFEPDAGDEEFNYLRLCEVYRHLRTQPVQPDLLLLTGDVADSGQPDSYERVRALIADAPFPVHLIPGNHDARQAMADAFPAMPINDGFAQYAIPEPGDTPLRLLCLDTLEEGRHGGAFCEVRARWLARELKANASVPTIIAMHHPPIVSGIEWMDPRPEEDWFQRFRDTIAGHDQVAAILAGHLHRPLHASVAGTPLSVTPAVAPAVSLDLRPLDPDDADGRAIVEAEPPFYSLHLWRGGSLVSHFQPVGPWQTLARFEDGLKPMMRGLLDERQ